ncbi:unnamed protein product [Blepharisma stoltei]|uniref:LNR domain-containing protein n=1 Tax=Blepharisma stoltei TaxID=1481888 RepID=A0AAU9J8Q1_9CILI|nr:unnamed protein product [Blepharisma stoltei]
MLNDGNCDEECNTAECRYDLNDCGWCAKDCKLEMINNGICDPECNNAECEYDGKDCKCAPNCKFEDYGKCKPECMVPDCNYDSIWMTCQNENLRKFYLYWQLLNYDFLSTQNIDFSNCTSSLNDNFISCQIYNLYETGELLTDNCESSCLKCTNSSDCVECDCSKGYINFFDKCVMSCPQGYSPHPLIPSICYSN